jgi:hypothetical protein
MSQTKTYESLFREVTSETGRRLVKIAQFGKLGKIVVRSPPVRLHGSAPPRAFSGVAMASTGYVEATFFPQQFSSLRH